MGINSQLGSHPLHQAMSGATVSQQAPSDSYSFPLLRARGKGTTPLSSSACFIDASFSLSSLPALTSACLPHSCSMTQTRKLTQMQNYLGFFGKIILNPVPWVVQTVRTRLLCHTTGTALSSFRLMQDVAPLVNCCQLIS